MAGYLLPSRVIAGPAFLFVIASLTASEARQEGGAISGIASGTSRPRNDKASGHWQ